MNRLSLPVTIKLGNNNFEPKAVIKNLGVKLDTNLSMQSQINNITSKCYFHIRKISKILKYLDLDAARSLINAYVISRMDYGNALLVNLPAYLVKKVQRVQNYAARVINRTGWRDSISRQLKDLHWLPVKQRIEFKILLLVYKSLNNLTPKYLKDMLKYHHTTRTLRSSHQRYLFVKRYRTRYGARSFSYIGPKLWNQLPLQLRTTDTLPKFKTSLKTYLFRKAFEATD